MSVPQAVFLDRDGVLNHRRTMLVRRPDHLRLMDGSAAAVRRFNDAGCRVIVVTNQSGVGYGIIAPDALEAVHARLQELLEAQGASVDAIYHCPHRKDETCACAKPRSGMLERGAEAFDLEPGRCWMVGDKPSDIEAGRAFGARTAWITGSRMFPWERWRRAEADVVAPTLAAATGPILGGDRDAP